ncbi:MAG TPA: signal peptidase I [Rubrobacteraceae bacterium]|nr:signal peptidase I [Rubrobacteraceae bacterium]
MSENQSYENQSYDRQFQTTGDRSREDNASSKKGGGGWLEFPIILIVAFALVFLFVRPYVVEAFYIPSESMTPTLEVGDRVLVNKFIYRFTEPERGDIIVFKTPEGMDNSVDGNPIARLIGWFQGKRDERQDLIKRVVGLPGDTITVRNGKLFVNGERQNEPYLNREIPDQSFFNEMTVPQGKVFVMGDNRTNSRDSRYIGPIPKENIEGEAFLRFWPPGRLGLI